MSVQPLNPVWNFPRLAVQDLQYNYLVRIRVYLGPDFAVGFDIPKDLMLELTPNTNTSTRTKRYLLEAMHTDIARQLALIALNEDQHA